MESLKALIRTVPDFPKKGIGFKDITTLIKNGDAFVAAVDELSDRFNPATVDLVLGIEARGFIFASALAYKWSKGFIPVRKPKKLPAETVRIEYSLEYGTDALEIHRDAIQSGQRVLIVDDLLATGGTVEAVCKLVEQLGGTIAGIGFLVELDFLKGRERLSQYKLASLISFNAE
jgi:adenine phosphoribosyltransferase